MRDTPIIGAEQPGQSLGPERFDAHCEECDRTWHAEGTLNCRRTFARAQKHADRMQHRIAAEWANRR